MKSKYYDLNGTHIAMIGKSGNTSIGKAIMLDLKPYFTVESASGDQSIVDKINNSAGVWQSAPKTDSPISPIIPVRDPVERFRSACAQDGVTDVDELLDKLEAEDRPYDGFHYRFTNNYLVDNSRLYKFPEHISEIAIAIGLESIPHVNDNESNNITKPDLTPEQQNRVEAIYADDIALYESITEAGQVYVAPEPVLSEEEQTAIAIKAAHDAAGQVFDGMAAGKRALWEPVRAAVQAALLSGDVATAVEIIQTVPALYEGMDDDRQLFLNMFNQ